MTQNTTHPITHMFYTFGIIWFHDMQCAVASLKGKFEHMRGTKQLELSEAEKLWLDRLKKIYTQVKRWYTDPNTLTDIQTGSPSKADDIEWLQPGLSAEYQIGIAVEHLKVSLDCIFELGRIYPTAPLTLGRTAYTSAINAAWLLYPTSRNERRRRAFTLKAMEINQELRALVDLPPNTTTPDTETKTDDALRVRLERKQAELTRIGQTFQPGINAAKVKFIQTNVIKTVTDELFGNELELENDVRYSVRYLWRVSSAAAHGYYHYALSRVSLPEPGDTQTPPDVAILDAKVDQDLGPLLLTSYVVISRAIRLHRLRATNHLEQR